MEELAEEIVEFWKLSGFLEIPDPKLTEEQVRDIEIKYGDVLKKHGIIFYKDKIMFGVRGVEKKTIIVLWVCVIFMYTSQKSFRDTLHGVGGKCLDKEGKRIYNKFLRKDFESGYVIPNEDFETAKLCIREMNTTKWWETTALWGLELETHGVYYDNTFIGLFLMAVIMSGLYVCYSLSAEYKKEIRKNIIERFYEKRPLFLDEIKLSKKDIEILERKRN